MTKMGGQTWSLICLLLAIETGLPSMAAEVGTTSERTATYLFSCDRDQDHLILDSCWVNDTILIGLNDKSKERQVIQYDIDVMGKTCKFTVLSKAEENPWRLACNKEGEVYVTDLYDLSVKIYNTATGSIRIWKDAAWNAANAPITIAMNDELVVVGMADETLGFKDLSVYNTKLEFQYRRKLSFDVLAEFYSMELNADGKLLLAPFFYPAQVLFHDLAKNETVTVDKSDTFITDANYTPTNHVLIMDTYIDMSNFELYTTDGLHVGPVMWDLIDIQTFCTFSVHQMMGGETVMAVHGDTETLWTEEIRIYSLNE